MKKIRFFLLVLFLPTVFLFSSCGIADNLSQALWDSERKPDKRLSMGIKNNDFEMINEALEAGADINKRSGILRDTPLLTRTRKQTGPNQDRLFLYIISKGADVNSKCKLSGKSMIWSYAWNGLPEECKILLEHGAKDVNGAIDGIVSKTDRDCTEKDLLEILNLLLEKGAKINESHWKTINSYDMHLFPKLKIKQIVLSAILNEGKKSGFSELIEAAIMGNHVKTIELLESGYKIPEEDYVQLIDFIAAFGSVESMEFLKVNGILPDTWTRDRLNPIMLAAYYSNTEMIQYLSQFIDIGDSTYHETDPFYYAILNGTVETVQCVLDSGYNVRTDKTWYGITTHNKNIDVLDFLLSKGCGVEEGETGELIDAFGESNYKKVAELLIQYGYIHDNSPDFPMIKFNLESIQYSTSHGAEFNKIGNSYIKNNILYEKCQVGTDIDSVKWLLEQGIDPNIAIGNDTEEFFRSPLRAAILYGNIECVKLLVEYGANLEMEITTGETYVMLSSKYGQENILRYLLAAGANADHQNKEGKTALMMAIDSGYTESAKILIKHGVNKVLEDNDGKIALDYAKKLRMKEITNLLTKKE